MDKSASPVAPEQEATVLALRELVECKDLKTRLEGYEAGSTAELADLDEEYARRKPVAWAFARQVLAGKPGPRILWPDMLEAEAKALDATGGVLACGGAYAAPASCSSEVAPAAPLLMQDENSGRDGRRYNEWHASRPDARLNAREVAAAMEGAPWNGAQSPLHQSLCMRPAPCSECDRIAALAATPAAPSAEASPDDDLLVACITLNGTTLTVEANALADMFGTDDEQHAYELTFKRMTRAAFEALGEFNGF